jgi:hypothetical protein
MAVITATDMTGSGSRAVTVTTLGASDTFVFNTDKTPVLYLNNVTAGALTPLIDGDGGTTTPCPGVGDVDVSAGLTLASIGIGDTVAIPLNSISAYLKGVITVTTGDGIEATLLEF